jgi:hypothetical protein
VTRDESAVLFGQERLESAHGRRPGAYQVDRWNNGEPRRRLGFSPLGGTLELPPSFACSARLLPQGPPAPADPGGVRRDFAVDEVGCSESSMARQGGVVISAAPATDEATELLALTPGTPMRLRWTLGWAGVFDAVGGRRCCSSTGARLGECEPACGRQPRTGVGVTSSGKILLVVVDGRQPRWSLGPTSAQFAQIMAELDAVTALNLDGGGSSEMVVEGEVVNRPSDGHERSITNAILVLPGPDPDEP